MVRAEAMGYIVKVRAARVVIAVALTIAAMLVGSCSVGDLTSGDGLEAETPDAGDARDAPGILADVDAMDAGGAMCALVTPPTSPVNIENQGNGRYLEVPVIPPPGSDASPGTMFGTVLDVNSFTGASNQAWIFQPVSDDSGTYRIVNDLSSDCVDVIGANTSNFTYLQQYGCYYVTNQQFWVCSSDGVTVQIKGRESGKCLTSVGDKDNAPVYIDDCSNDITEQWTLGQ